MSLEAVTFDFWDTLVCAPAWEASQQRRAERLAVALEALGHRTDAAALARAVRQVADTFDQRWEANEPFDAAGAVDVLVAELALAASREHRAELVEVLATTRNPPRAELTANVADALRALKGRGLRLGIVCDVGLQPSTVLRGHLQGHGLLELFDHWSFSDEVGCYKPHAPIFEHALGGLGVADPSRAAHVGDLRRTDVAGALAMGMVAVRYRGRKDDPGPPGAPEAPHVVDDHADLVAVLGLDRP